jgi:hypothetical protein
MYDIILNMLIVTTLCLYLYVDGKRLVVDILACMAFVLIMAWVMFAVAVAVVSNAVLVVAGPLLRLFFNSDNSPAINKVIGLAIRMMTLGWLTNAIEKAKENAESNQ